MFGWRRRSEGFEWREYVRTTVLVRRADRQRRIDDVREAAVNKVKDTADRGVAAGRAGVENVTRTGGQIIAAAAHAVGQVLAGIALTAYEIIKAAALWAWDLIASAAHAAGQMLRAAGTAIVGRLPAMPRPTLSLPALPRKLTAARAHAGPDGQPMQPDTAMRWPISPNILGGAALLVALVVLVGPMLTPESALTEAKFVPPAALVADAPRETSAIVSDAAPGEQIIFGRATAVSGAQLRVDGRFIQLSGIEAPDAAQRCLMENGREWNCGAAARDALERMIRRKSVACTPASTTDGGVVLANCSVGDVDLAAELVSNGHVFATSGLFAAYSSIESEARAAKLGIWQGESKRPAEWREQIWQDAKRAAPDGCPIKARAAQRVYSMPWSKDYDSRRMRTGRGDRWFCTEEEAQAAGFKLSSRS